jgi:hypothetical protein
MRRKIKAYVSQNKPFPQGGKPIMAKVAPWYSTRVGENRHHDNTKCTEGNNIETYYRKAGTGGYPLCKHCADLDAQGK